MREPLESLSEERAADSGKRWGLLENSMRDVAYCLVTSIFFGIAIAYVRALANLRGGDHE